MAISQASTSTINSGFSKRKNLKVDPILPVKTGLIMWYDASNTSSLTLAGNNVAQWNDLSGNGRHASEASARPQYVANAINGRAAIDFGTSSQYRLIIANPVTFISKNFHFFAVVKTRQESPTDYSAIIGTYLYPTSTTGNLAWSFPGNGAPNGAQQLLCGSVAWGPAGSKTDYLSTNFYNVNVSCSSGTSLFRAGRADDGGGSFGSTVSTTTNALGWQEGQSYGGNVTLAEVICFGYKLSDSDRNSVENYLYDKWGV